MFYQHVIGSTTSWHKNCSQDIAAFRTTACSDKWTKYKNNNQTDRRLCHDRQTGIRIHIHLFITICSSGFIDGPE
jgi:hypothetical protein